MSQTTFLYDQTALDRIRALLNSGHEWNAAMVEQIATIVRATTREVQKAPRIPPASAPQRP